VGFEGGLIAAVVFYRAWYASFLIVRTYHKVQIRLFKKGANPMTMRQLSGGCFCLYFFNVVIECSPENLGKRQAGILFHCHEP
jgi:hypothetical protein